ncbi:aminopeptidase P family protein [Rhizobium leguminosarum]|nr:aminopeptidase P family protein [Rhizobium leguminosarum]
MQSVLRPPARVKFPAAPEVPKEEQELRLRNIRREMDADGLDAIVLTDVKNMQYFTSYRTLHWYFNSRPVFVVVTSQDLIVFAAYHEKPHIEQKPRAFSARFYDGYVDEGVKLLVDTVRDLFQGKALRIGIDYGEEMNGRGSLPLIEGLQDLSAGTPVKSAATTLWRVRQIKSRFEADLKRTAFTICDAAFDQTMEQAHIGITEYELWGAMQAQMFLNGADAGDPFPVIFGNGDFTYGRPATGRRLTSGDYIWADFRATYGGYPADRNRIARAGEPQPWELDAYKAVRDMTLELCNSIRIGMTCSEVHAMARKMWEPVSVGQRWLGVKRFGHGGGMDLTEPPSLQATDHTIIRPGMILHVEPKLEREGAVFQFEECIYTLDDGVEFLAPLCPETMLVVR